MDWKHQRCSVFPNTFSDADVQTGYHWLVSEGTGDGPAGDNFPVMFNHHFQSISNLDRSKCVREVYNVNGIYILELIDEKIQRANAEEIKIC